MVCTCADTHAFWGPHAAMRTLIPVVLVQRSSVPVLEGVAPAACSMPSRWEHRSYKHNKHTGFMLVWMPSKHRQARRRVTAAQTQAVCVPLSVSDPVRLRWKGDCRYYSMNSA